MTSALILPRSRKMGRMLAKALRRGEREDGDDDEREPGHARADAEQDDEREHGGQQAADELDQAGADEVADAFDVVHDARDQDAGFVGVVVGDGQAADVLPALSGAVRRSGAGRLWTEAA